MYPAGGKGKEYLQDQRDGIRTDYEFAGNDRRAVYRLSGLHKKSSTIYAGDADRIFNSKGKKVQRGLRRSSSGTGYGRFAYRGRLRYQFFFDHAIAQFNKGYNFLSPEEDAEGAEEGEGRDQAQSDSGGDAGNYKWLRLIDLVSETTHERWSDIWTMGIYEFFNYLSYVLEKNRREKAEIEKFKKR